MQSKLAQRKHIQCKQIKANIRKVKIPKGKQAKKSIGTRKHPHTTVNDHSERYHET